MTTTNNSLINAQANFAFNLLREINGSTVISPFSISNALGMILLGARNNTTAEIQNAIAGGTNPDEIHRHFSKMYSFLNDINKGKDLEKTLLSFKNDVMQNRKLKMAVKAYFAEGLNLNNFYKNDITNFYNGDYEFINFFNPEIAASNINKFVEEATDSEIQEIIEHDQISESTKLILVNAIIFEGKWENPFTLLPSKMMFYSPPDVSKEISAMETEIYCRYINNDEFQFLEMPYQGKAFSMYLILPHKRYGLSELLENINITEILNMMSSNNFMDGKIIIPKFEVSSFFNLNQILNNLNINDAFDKEKADFSGICEEKIHVALTLHKAFIKVNEEGTKAGAATFIEGEDVMFEEKGETFEFIADHPFLYLIADKEKNIFFIGNFYN